MSRRIDVELTSSREDGSWTWRAAGARQPKGVLDGGLLPAGASVGDVLRADVETDIDGTTVIAVLPPKEKKVDADRVELLTSGPRDDQLVTSTLVGKGGRGGDRRERRGGDRRDRGGDDRGRGRDDRGPRRGRDDHGRGDRDNRGGERRERRPADREGRPTRPRREPPPEVPSRPKPKRLKPGRAHRKAAIDALAPEEAVIAEQVLRGGVPGVRQAVEKQNEQARAQGQPEVKADPLIAIAERLLPRLRAAEWQDRAEAALESVEEVDLRDLRSIVVAAETAAKTDETRDLATQLREALTRRVEAEQTAWLDELKANLDAGRVVRALRLSSHPPKAGAPLPADVATRLTEAAAASLTSDTGSDRWSTVLDALTFSPVRQQVTPASLPEKPSDELLAAVTRVSDRLPQIAAVFGIEPKAPSRRRTRSGAGGGGGGGGRGGAKSKPKSKPKPKATESEPTAPAAATPTTDEAAPEEPPAEVRDAATSGGAEAATSVAPEAGDVAGTITPSQPDGASGEPNVDLPVAPQDHADPAGLEDHVGPDLAGADAADEGDRPS